MCFCLAEPQHIHLAKPQLQQQRELWVHWPGHGVPALGWGWNSKEGCAAFSQGHTRVQNTSSSRWRNPSSLKCECWRDSVLHITAANRGSCCLPPGDLQNTTSEIVHKLPNPVSSFILNIIYFFLQLDLPWLSFCKVKQWNPCPHWGLCL